MHEQNKNGRFTWHVVALVGVLVSATGIMPRMYYLIATGGRATAGEFAIALGLIVVCLSVAFSVRSLR